jgi:DNA-binding XRE family transcriptional regulator
MARPKLSNEQREALRDGIRDRLASGERVAAIVADLVAKYSVSSNTVRWHMKRVIPTGGLVGSRRGKRGRKATRVDEGQTRDNVVRKMKEEFDRLLERDLEIRRAHVENLRRIQELNLQISDRLIQGLETLKPRGVGTPTPSAAMKSAPGYESFGARVKQLRKASGMTLDEVSRRLGTHKGYVSGIETGKTNPPSPKFVVKFARLYSVDEKELLRMALVEKTPAAIRGDLIRAFWPAPPAPAVSGGTP